MELCDGTSTKTTKQNKRARDASAHSVRIIFSKNIFRFRLISLHIEWFVVESESVMHIVSESLFFSRFVFT